mmetsp:Transcript_39669/g.86590  ORF Transcript_39669/g.86590 Transcript_39669/m.86590 type:complete len:415 (+) Transcript_39669:926-2170(+)
MSAPVLPSFVRRFRRRVCSTAPALSGSSARDVAAFLLTRGGDYDVATVELAVADANDCFLSRNFQEASLCYGVAYCLLRLCPTEQFYAAQAHDILLRKAMSHSRLGDSVAALDAVETALAIVPFAPGALCFKGHVLLRSCEMDAGLACIRRAVASDPSLWIVQQVLVAVWWHTQGFFDKAIATSSALVSSSGNVSAVGRMAALHIRAESRKFHHSGTQVDQASSDFMELVVLGPPAVIASRFGSGFAGSNITVVDEWLSLLHVSFSELCPRPIVFYPCARKRVLDIVGLVVSFVGILKRRMVLRKRLGMVCQAALLLRDRAVALDCRWKSLELVTRRTLVPALNSDPVSPSMPALVPLTRRLPSSVCRACTRLPWPRAQSSCDQCDVHRTKEVTSVFSNHQCASHGATPGWLAC